MAGAMLPRRRESPVARACRAERERIGRDLHDGVLQALYALGLRLETIRTQLDAQPAAARASLTEGRQEVDRLIEQVREISQGLQSNSRCSASLVSSLAQLRAECPAPVSLDLAADAGDSWTEEQRESVVAIAREALANIHRHARATRARLSWRGFPTYWQLLVEDDGVGLGGAPGGGGDLGGLGLVLMAHRVASLGGTLTLSSPATGGTIVELKIPRRRGARKEKSG
jgi:signal transduction histidine kinase